MIVEPISSTIKLTPVDSSQIHAIGHDPKTNTLAIHFKAKKGPGTLYHYANFSDDDFAKFQAAESKGSHFIKVIKPATEKWPFRKIAEVSE